MTAKELPVEALASELTGASLFFPAPKSKPRPKETRKTSI